MQSTDELVFTWKLAEWVLIHNLRFYSLPHKDADTRLVGGCALYKCNPCCCPCNTHQNTSDAKLVLQQSTELYSHILRTTAADARDITSIAAPLNLSEAGIVLLAVSDNDDVETAGGGTHWQVYVYD